MVAERVDNYTRPDAAGVKESVERKPRREEEHMAGVP